MTCGVCICMKDDNMGGKGGWRERRFNLDYNLKALQVIVQKIKKNPKSSLNWSVGSFGF